MIILKSVTFTMTTDSPPRAPPLESRLSRQSHGAWSVQSTVVAATPVWVSALALLLARLAA